MTRNMLVDDKSVMSTMHWGRRRAAIKHKRAFALGFVCFLLQMAACSSSDGDAVGAGKNSAAATGGDAGDCDPRAIADAGRDGTVTVTVGQDGPAHGSSGEGTIDLDAGEPAPVGRLSCLFGCTGASTCCELKSVCYDPALEPTFCDRPYCP